MGGNQEGIPIVNDTQFCEWVGDRGYPMTIIIDKEGLDCNDRIWHFSRKKEAIKQTIKSLRKP